MLLTVLNVYSHKAKVFSHVATTHLNFSENIKCWRVLHISAKGSTIGLREKALAINVEYLKLTDWWESHLVTNKANNYENLLDIILINN